MRELADCLLLLSLHACSSLRAEGPWLGYYFFVIIANLGFSSFPLKHAARDILRSVTACGVRPVNTPHTSGHIQSPGTWSIHRMGATPVPLALGPSLVIVSSCRLPFRVSLAPPPHPLSLSQASRKRIHYKFTRLPLIPNTRLSMNLIESEISPFLARYR